MTSVMSRAKTTTGVATLASPTLTLQAPVTNGMQMPVGIGENGTTITFLYTDTANIPNNTTVTVSNFSNCYLWDATKSADPFATQATAAVVPGSDPTKGTATFLMGTRGAVGAVAGFSAQVNDSASTKLTPDFASAPMTETASGVALFGIDTSYLPSWNGTGEAPSVQAIARLTSTDGATKYPGVDVILIAQGFAEGIDAFAQYVDVYDNTGNTKLTPSPYKATYQGNTYTTYRLQGDRNFGKVYVYLKPKAPQTGDLPIQGFVDMVGMFASSQVRSPGLYVLNAQNPSGNTISDSPEVERVTGLCLKPFATDTAATIWIPLSNDLNLGCYALIGQKGTQTPTILAAQLPDDADIEVYNGVQQVKFQIPLANLAVCATASDDHGCENCTNADLNTLSFMYCDTLGQGTYSDSTGVWLDTTVLNIPHPPTQVYAAPLLFQGKMVSNQLVADETHPILPGTAITPQSLLGGGLVIRISDQQVANKKVQGQVYQNGLGAWSNGKQKQRRDIFNLLQTPQAASGTGTLDIPWPADQVAGYDYGGGEMSDAGFFVVFWDVVGANTPGSYSNVYRTILDSSYL
ncbi:hypothetical protein [Bradyrhizobium sp. LHD-71]|uniref:hypothetical protein n=1 Tax=Bradyrhizobium sp. LHD-71 TaxID=3072141 RepID=UPI00280CDB87|nr:hypothetical protein [Bradyrhizobium sp. LHD-71]MDQ8730264.1 hypothetical protein [Bradyrhizobium sp. LHD-71]